ncbi:MAG: M48 family metallopeptidase [Betaproteobacteria bacterium]|nr:M48 family metallopeptidase [Betaproteobacteria bacterium]
MKSSLYPDQDLRRRALAWALKLRVNPRVVRVQAMRRKWGSCSSAGTVTLARDLVDQETCFQDYVIVHELLHLRQPTHGRLFKALMSAYVPGWQTMAARRFGESRIHTGLSVPLSRQAGCSAAGAGSATTVGAASGGRPQPRQWPESGSVMQIPTQG